MARPDLGRMLRPRSIAVIGGRPAAEVVRQLGLIGFEGAVWPVHPSRDEVGGHRAYRSVEELPEAPDAAFVAVNRDATIEIVASLAARGAGGAVAYASGFSETAGIGHDLQRRLVEAAGAMPVLGPNCYGLINYLDGALLWPDQHGGKRVSRGVALVTQSGNIGCNLTMQRRALPIAYLVTLGNQAIIDLAAAIEALLDDPRVTAIGLHSEGVGDAAAFAEAAERARRRGIPIMALKTGRSEGGARLTISHTASLAGSGAAIDAFLRKHGVVTVRSIPVLLETLKILHLGGPLAGRDIASMSCSGGEAALMADALEGRSLRFRPFSAGEVTRVSSTLGELVTVSNPLDYHTFIWAKGEALAAAFTAVMAAEFAMTLLVLDFPRADRCDDRDWWTAAEALAVASKRTGGRAAVVATLPECLPEERAEMLAAEGIMPLFGIDDAVAALEAAAEAGTQALGRQRESLLSPLAAASGERGPQRRREMLSREGAPPTGLLDEWRGKQLLARYDIAVPEGRLVQDAQGAVEAAEAIGYPVVVKAVGTAIAHKSEVGAVRLDLRDAAEVQDSARDLLALSDALLVERMVTGAVAELIVGINRDPVVGLHLVLGAGGILAELIGDRCVLAMPASSEEIAAALGSLKTSALLSGYRGKPKGDIEAVIRTVLAVQSLALDHADRLMELDINPLIVRAQGAIAADVLIRFAEEKALG